MALYTKWSYEDKKKSFKDGKLVDYQYQKCKAIGNIIFKFALYKKQIDTI